MKKILTLSLLALFANGAFAKSVVLGSRTICDQEQEKVIRVDRPGRFAGIQLLVNGHGRVEIHEVEVTFRNGGEMERDNFRDEIKNDPTRVLYFKNGPRRIAKVELEMDTEDNSGCALVTVMGVK